MARALSTLRLRLKSAEENDEYSEALTKTNFPRTGTHGVAHLIYPTVHEIAARGPASEGL